MEFQCSQCGQCCRRVGLVPGFPEPIDENGACVHLTDDHRCAIYETRPKICRVAVMGRKNAPKMSERQYFAMTADICNGWIRQAGMNEKYLLDPTIYDEGDA